MPSPIFIDANIPMYAGGRPHPLKAPCVQILILARDQPQAFCTDAEVLQEILHRYVTAGTWTLQGKVIFEEFAALMDGRIEPVSGSDVVQAATLADQYVGLSARDLLHVAVMVRVGATHVVSADRGFDVVPQLQRLDPAAVAVWQGQVTP
jgi:predicted nucleic acid-binding protein